MMSDVTIIKNEAALSEKPVGDTDDSVKFPPFPEPGENDFEDDISDDEKEFYKSKYKDLSVITKEKLHCTACDRHLGCAARKESRMRMHPMLKTLVCHTCHSFYNSGEFDKGEDGSELYCRWCGQGGQVYCCSDCCHVFCAKCIKRNLGIAKIKEIESLDDWKCFKCNNKCLWDLRASCWAVLRYCDLKNKFAALEEDKKLRDFYEKDCSIDFSECCKLKNKQRAEKMKEKRKSIRKEKDKEKEKEKRNSSNNIEKAKSNSTDNSQALISKIPPTIQVKKFASINLDDSPEKTRKRPASPPRLQTFQRIQPIVQSNNLFGGMVSIPPPMKKYKPAPSIVRQNIRPMTQTYNRPYRPRMPVINPLSVQRPQYNGYGMNNMGITYNPFNAFGDNINLSLDNLTQGLDMAAVAAMTNNPSQDELVCTPDFPLEPMCEVTEENNDDDVECITPSAPSKTNPQKTAPIVPDITSDNIVQMTEDDVTVNSVTGGLKFRVDPQTLSSNKMYRLPDGRIFAINANPNMPGGYSATIVAVTENKTGKTAPKGATYAAKVNPVVNSPSPPPLVPRNLNKSLLKNKLVGGKSSNKSSKGNGPPRACDMNTPVEWYRYNLIDAIDALDYSVHRLQKLKKGATTMFLRTRSVPEMRSLHKTFENLLRTSKSRFEEIRCNLNKGFKQYLSHKECGDKVTELSEDDDDDVEILDTRDDGPIFIDENSLDSNANDNSEVDLTVTTSDHNDSGEQIVRKDPLKANDVDKTTECNDTSKDLTKDNSVMEVDDANESGDKSKDRNETTEKDKHSSDLEDGAFKDVEKHEKYENKDAPEHTVEEENSSEVQNKDNSGNEAELQDKSQSENKLQEDDEKSSEPQKNLSENGEEEQKKEEDSKDYTLSGDEKVPDDDKCDDKKSSDEKSDDEQEVGGKNRDTDNKENGNDAEVNESRVLEECLQMDENDSKQEVEMTEDFIDSLLKDDEGADLQNIDSMETSEILG